MWEKTENLTCWPSHAVCVRSNHKRMVFQTGGQQRVQSCRAIKNGLFKGVRAGKGSKHLACHSLKWHPLWTLASFVNFFWSKAIHGTCW